MTDVVLDNSSRSPWNRNDKRGLAISIILPFLAVLIGNGAVYALGWNSNDPAYEAVSFNPPGGVVAVVWLIIFPMWGAARWYAYQTGVAGRRASYWILALIGWALLYPVITSGSNTLISASANAASLVLVITAALQARAVSKRAFWLIAPSIAWIGFATVLGFFALSHA